MESKGEQATEARFEIPIVSEELYRQTYEALAREGYTFIVAIEPVSIGQLATGEATSQHFKRVDYSENMRAIVPPKMEVAINPNKLRIRNSNSGSTHTQIRMIQEEETALKGKLPKEVRDLISMYMQNASVLVQVDSEYHEKTRKKLLTNWYGRTDDYTRPGHTGFSGHNAGVGRFSPAGRLIVRDLDREGGYDDVFAVPVVVLPRKSAV